MKKILLSLMIVLGIGTVSAADYVDEINNASTAAVGQRVIYEMNVGEFTQAGTFAAAQQQLGELKTLGVDVVWLMPIYPRGGDLNSPYAPKDFKQVNPAYGTISDLKAFVAEAHRQNMQVWLDWVPNHTATNADWVTSHPEYYTKTGGNMVHPNNYNDVYQLEYYNNGLVNAMNDCLKFWIDEADIDGYRCDYVSSSTIPSSYWKNTIPMIKSYKAGKTIEFLAESDLTWDNYLNNSNVGFNYDYAWRFQENLATFGPNGTSAVTLKNNAQTMLTESAKYTFKRMLYLTNHDLNYNNSGKTLANLYGNNRYPLTVLEFTLYGMPLIYNGQEIGGNQVLNYFSDTKINWNNVDNKMRNTVRTLTALKHGVPALGEDVAVTWLTSSNNNVLAYSRKSGDSEVLVLLNLSASAVSNVSVSGLSAGEWSLWLNSETVQKGTSRISQTLSATQTFSIDAKGYRVFVKGSYDEEDNTGYEGEVYTPVLDSEDEICLFFETPTETTYSVWGWGNLGGGEAYCNNTSWPGDAMTLKGKTSDGKFVYKYTFTKTTDIPNNFIISRNMGTEEKIFNGPLFVNHGYYIEGAGTNPDRIITAGIIDIHADGNLNGSDAAAEYTIDGVLVTGKRHHGIFVRGGKKYLRR